MSAQRAVAELVKPIDQRDQRADNETASLRSDLDSALVWIVSDAGQDAEILVQSFDCKQNGE